VAEQFFNTIVDFISLCGTGSGGNAKKEFQAVKIVDFFSKVSGIL
jgi:hypothetical protein